MTISFSGLASGLDTTSWVESLVKLKQAKVTTLQQQKESAILSRDTLTSIRTFFNSFRSVLQKITDSRFNVANMDLFAQNIATSSKLNILTATATTEAEEASYKVKVDKLASKTSAVSEFKGTTTIVEKTTATSDTKLSRLGVTAGDIVVLAPDGQQYEISIGTNDTIQTLVDKLAIYGVEASFNNNTGIFNINLNASDIEDGTTGLKTALNLSDVENGYITRNQLITTKEEIGIIAPTLETAIGELGVNSGQLTINTGAGEINVDITSTMTFAGLISKLESNNIHATYDHNTGVFELTGAEIVDDGDTNLISAFGLDLASSSTVNADENYYLSDFGFTGENVQVTLHREGDVATSITVNGSDTIGDFITNLNSNGVNASIENGVITIENGYIENNALETALGLTKDVGGSYCIISDSVVETIKETATGASKLGDIIRALGTESVVEDGYELVFNGQTINVSETTTINDIISEVNALGGNATIDASGNLTINDGILTGSVAEALGITNVNTRIDIYGETSLYAKITVTATPTTTLGYLGVRTSITPEFTNSITQLTQTQAEAAGYTWVTTQEELTAALATNNSSVKVMLGADIAISDWETIGSSDSTKFKGELNGNGHKITGLNTTLFYGLSGATVKNLGFENITSTVAVLATSADGRIENCYVSNATISFGGYRGILVDNVSATSSLVIDSCNIYNSSIASSNQAAGGFIGQVLKSDITIQNSGIYNSSVSGISGAGAFIGSARPGSLDSNIAIQNCTTSASLTGDTVGLIGIDYNNGGGAREISNITYDSKDYYDRDQYEGQVITPGLGKELAVYDSNKCLVGTIDMTGTSTIQDLFDELSSYGITGSINNSVITLTSTNGNFVAGQVIDDLGLEFSTTNGTTTVGLDVTSANSIYYTETIIATGSTTLGQLGIITGTPLDKYLKETGFVKMTATEANSLGYTQVTTAEELHTALSNNENVVLMNDIDLSGYNWEQINSYNATLDGNGYSIKNLSMTDVESGGMFSEIWGCIKNLNITNANIEADDYGEFIAVLASDIVGTATNIFIDGNVTANGCSASGFADFYTPDSSSNYLENIWVDVSINNNNGISSGFINTMEADTLNISNIITSGTLTGNEVYGFAYSITNSESTYNISNISSYAELEGNKNYLLTDDESVDYITNGKFDYRVNPHLDTIPGITQANISGSMNEISILSKTGDYIGKIDIDENTTLDDLSMALSSYGITAELSAEGVLNITSSSKRMVSGFVAEQLGISYNDRTERSIKIGAADTSSSKVVFTNTTKASNTSTLGSINYTKVINGTITASGVVGDVIGISSASELKMLADLVNSGESMSGKTFVLTTDIDLSGYENWEAIEGFQGNFYGQGYTISGLKQTLNSTNNESGLFYIGEGGVVKELKISNANITVEDSYTSNVLGFLAGANRGTINGITIESSTITGTSTNIGFVGAISGQTSGGTIKNCKTMDDIDLGTHSNAYLGGIVGVVATGGYVENCENNININNTHTAGGIVGAIYYNTFSSCNTTIKNCLNNGNITATNDAGGIVGVASASTLGSSNTVTLEDCVNTGTLSGARAKSFISQLYCSSNPNSYTYTVNMTDCYSTFTDNATPYSNLSSAFSITISNINTNLDLATIKTNLDSTSAGKFAYDADSGNLTVLRSNIWSLYSVDASGAATLIDIDGSTTIQELDAMLDNWSFNTSTSKGAVSSGSLVGGCASKLKNITMYSYTPEVLTEETSITKSLSGEDLHTSFAIVFTEAETGNTIKETLFLGCGDESCTVTNCSTSTIHTYGDFLDVFRNHGIEAYIENGKVYINAEDDVYYSVSVLTGGTISSAYTTLMSDLKLSTEMGNTVNISSTTYNTSTTSSELKYTTYRQMGTDSKLEDLASAVGQTTNGLRIGIVSNGSSLGMTTASSAGWTTMQDVIDYLETNGIEAYISDGKITVNSSEDSYILSCNTTFTNACGITANSQVVTSTIYASTSESNDLSKIEYPEMDSDIKLENIIATNGSTLDSYELVLNTKSLDNEDLSFTITFDATSTLGDVETWLNEKGVALMIEENFNYKIFLESTNYADFSLSGDLGDYLLGNSTKMYIGTNTASNLEQQEMLNESSILSDLGVTNGSIEVYVNGVKNTLNIDSSKSYSYFKTQLLSLGIDSSINEMGEMTLNSMVPGDKISFVTPISGGSNIAEILGINAYEEGVQFAQAGTKLTLNRNQVSIGTESITEVPVVVDENTLISDFDNGLVVSEGTLSVTVDGVKSNIRITEDETFGSFMEKLRNVGLESSLVNGELLIHNNNQEFTINIDESTSNIMTLLGIESNDALTGYSSSEDTVTKNTSIVEERNYSVSSWANNTTQLNLLGITDGSFSVFRDGKKETLAIDSTKTFENLQTQLNDKFGEDLELTFEDGYLKISSKTGAKVEVNSSTDTSNFAAITGISSDGKKSVISARQLYNVNTESKLTDTGLFRRGTVAEGTFTIGDAEFTIDENTTLANIISQINNTENAGAIAYWDTVDGKLVLTSKSNGAALINIEAGSSNFTDILGFTSSQWADVDGDLNPDVGESSATITKINVNTQTLGDNASFYINGTHFTSTSNTVSSDVSRIKGLTLELKNISEGEEVIVTVKKDNDSLANAVQEVVDSYNTLITNIDKQIEQGSPLNNEFTLKLLRNQIRSMMTSTVSTGSTFKNLSSIGITTGEAVSGNISTEGLDTLTFDKEKFMEAYSSDSLAVKTLLVGEDGSSGLFNQIESIVTQAESANGYFSSAQNSYNKQIQNITSKISRAETSVARYRSRLESKFASMDLLISQMQNNYSSFLSA